MTVKLMFNISNSTTSNTKPHSIPDTPQEDNHILGVNDYHTHMDSEYVTNE